MTSTVLARPPLTDDRSFQLLKKYVITATGLVYYATRDNEFAGYLQQRLKDRCLKDCYSYLELLRSGSEGDVELDCLIEKLTIGETFFFRHRELFDSLQRKVIPDLLIRNAGHRRLRIWSAGSSIGAEAYSVSILLRRHFAEQLRGWDVSIVGTDINRDFLARASTGVFEEWALRTMSDAERDEYFTLHNKRWSIKPHFREGVSFQYHNLALHPYPSVIHNLCAFDIILCRNVIIYFSQDLIRTTVRKFHECLIDGGWLLTGHAEHNADVFGEFRRVNSEGATVYQRIDNPVVTTALPVTPDRPWVSPLPAPVVPAWPDTERVTVPDLVSTSDRRTRHHDHSPNNSAENSHPVLQLTEIRHMADRGDLERASAECERLLTVNELNPACHFYQALILAQKGQHEQVKHALRRAIYLDRSCVMAHYYLGVTLQRLRQPGPAARSLRNVLDLLSHRDPDQVVDDFDGLSATELSQLTRRQLDTIEL